jgi:LysM repeat protein
MSKWWAMVLCCVCVACTPYDATVIQVAPASCGVFTLPDASVSCRIFNDNQYLLTTDQSNTLTYQTIMLTFDGALFVEVDSNTLLVLSVNGTTVVGIEGASRIMQAGSQLQIDLNSTTLSQPIPFDSRDFSAQTLSLIQQNVSLPTPIAPPADFTPRPSLTPSPTPLSLTDIAIGTATLAPTQCVPREDWAGQYTIQNGDVLARIARRYGVTLEDMQQANCIDNPDRIAVGLELNVPDGAVPNPSVPVANVSATPTPSAVAFRTDVENLLAGECTNLRWDVFNISEIFIDETLTIPNNSQQVCPTTTTTYTLRVVYPDGTQSTHAVTITVQP